MARIADIIAFLTEFAPLELAEDWDNVGLLLGDPEREASAVMTCLTLTPDVAAEAVERGAQFVVSHHPVLYRPVQRLTSETLEGRMLLELIASGVGVYSPHTGYDTAREGINQQLADLLELSNIEALRPRPPAEGTAASAGEAPGAGRYGTLPSPITLGEFIERVKQRLRTGHVQYVGDREATVERVGVACGSGAEFLRDADRRGCQALLTGEARFHACLEARGLGMALVLPGHYATERPGMERLAEVLARRFPRLTVWASDVESDPVQWG
jgi:dinuclear metal center YbgI/SA1388 family protein